MSLTDAATAGKDALRLKTICVFAGSSRGADPAHARQAHALGRALATSGRTLVTGAARVGLMGAVAEGALSAGGKVRGVVPRALIAKEITHTGLTDLEVVETMHERKASMAKQSDAFVILPGGLGTLDELFEMWTWSQLGFHHKPLGLLGRALYAPLLGFLDGLVTARFLRQEHRQMIVVSDDPEELLARLETQEIPNIPKWIDEPR